MNREEYRYNKLRRAGFLPREAAALKGENIGSPEMIAVIQDRRALIREYRSRGLSDKADIRQRLSAEARGVYGTLGRAALAELEEVKLRPVVVERRQRMELVYGQYRDRYADLREEGLTVKEAKTVARMSWVAPEDRAAQFGEYKGKYKGMREHGFSHEQARRLGAFDAKTAKQQAGYASLLEVQAREAERRIAAMMKKQGLTRGDAEKAYEDELNDAIMSGDYDPWEALRDILSPAPKGKGGGGSKGRSYSPAAGSRARKAAKAGVK